MTIIVTIINNAIACIIDLTRHIHVHVHVHVDIDYIMDLQYIHVTQFDTVL